jgi:MinD superfamily P-loop ATPase
LIYFSKARYPPPDDAPMQIAVASGKGGTGKTTIATSLALSLVNETRKADALLFLDCDVEAPNAHLYLKPTYHREQKAIILIPEVNQELCTACGKCVEVCQFHALALIGKKVLVFPQLCHGCGSCTWNCPQQAIVEIPNPIGQLEAGLVNEMMGFARGVLTISEPMPTPIIRQLKRWQPGASIKGQEQIVILDAPPGASCSVVETLRGSDFVLLVTEPTPFGLHDLKQMVGILHGMDIPAGVVINREGIGDGRVDAFCAAEGLPILLRIPFDRQIAEGLSAGRTLLDIVPEYEGHFQQLYQKIRTIVEGRL